MRISYWSSDVCSSDLYADNTARMQNLDSLPAAMSSVLRQHGRAHWLAAFDAAGVPAGPVHDIGQALTHPQVLARNMVVELEHPQAGPTRALDRKRVV